MKSREVIEGYGARADALASMLGTVVRPEDRDRSVIEAWATTVDGSILDVGAGTGRWSGHLTALGHDVVGLEPVGRFVSIARDTHPGVEFRRAEIADLAGSPERWTGILAWYSLIHLGPTALAEALRLLRAVLDYDGTMLLSFFTGPRLEAVEHPAATAYRWPMTDMAGALERAGFEEADRLHEPDAAHAAMLVRRN